MAKKYLPIFNPIYALDFLRHGAQVLRVQTASKSIRFAAFSSITVPSTRDASFSA